MSGKEFDVGDRVVFARNGDRGRGRVTQCLNKRRKVVTDTGKRIEVPLAELKSSRDGVLILEGRLERNLKSSKRIYGPAIQQMLYAFNVETLYERIHTKEDLRGFLSSEGRSVHNRFIHLICHGAVPRPGGAHLSLTLEKVNLLENVDMFKGLEGKILIFSCCSIGEDDKTLHAIKEVSKAAAIVAYRKNVYDGYTLLAEMLLYDQIITNANAAMKAATDVADALRELQVLACEEMIKKPPIVCL